MSFLSKVELKRQLQQMGIKVEGNYVRKKDIEKIYAIRDKFICPFCDGKNSEGETFHYSRSGNNVPEHFDIDYVSVSWACDNPECKSEWEISYHANQIINKEKGKTDQKGHISYPWSR